MASLLLAVIYLSFISLGLPDSLLGAAWPAMYPDIGVPVSYAGLISMIISLGTIVSCLLSGTIIAKLGNGKVTALSVAMTAAALFGFSVSDSYIMLCLCAIPYGLGAGCVDAALNHYVALHFSSRHMNWLHCMWGIGASVGPYIMGLALSGGMGWSTGYRIISAFQIVLTALLIFALPLWRKQPLATSASHDDEPIGAPLSLAEVFRVRGAKQIMITFFCYCGLEQTIGLWAGSFLTLCRGLSAEQAAGWASLYYVGITIGRVFSGFLAEKLSDQQLVRLGIGITAVGIVMVALPLGWGSDLVGLIVTGLGCAPIYPSVIHSTPAQFGAANAQSFIGVQVASAYAGYLILPPLFGLLANHVTPMLFPLYMAIILALLTVTHEMVYRLRASTEGKE